MRERTMVRLREELLAMAKRKKKKKKKKKKKREEGGEETQGDFGYEIGEVKSLVSLYISVIPIRIED
jgi:hypothetical protein